MDRREFFRRTGGGILLGAPLAGLPAAAAAMTSPDRAMTQLVVLGQADRAGAISLAQRGSTNIRRSPEAFKSIALQAAKRSAWLGLLAG